MAAIDFNDAIQTPRTGFLDKLVNLMVKIANSDRRVREIQFLSSLTNEQLKERGLTRDQIVHRVYGGAYYL